jgi:hypothetical protein
MSEGGYRLVWEDSERAYETRARRVFKDECSAWDITQQGELREDIENR